MAGNKQTVLQAVKGMNDILPPESARWEWFEHVVGRLMRAYGYQNLRTPVVEHTALFVRGLGEVTDIVEKEMYSFEDAMNGDRLSLRPEATAGIVRATIEHNALYNGPLRVWNMGPVFRHERPQKGRYRQFHQLDVEALGLPGPDVDAELILMLRRLWQDLGLQIGRDVKLQINSLGQASERAAHRTALVAYFDAHAEQLDDDSRRRLQSNPLRILDSKNPALQAINNGAPQLISFLGPESLAHFNGLQQMLRAAGLEFQVNPRLVRGMDYYTHTVFEWVTDRLGAQGTVCGGGRYDGLMESLGGKPAPGIGFGLGIERLLLLLEEAAVAVPTQAPDVYAIVPDAAAMPQVLVVLEQLRDQGLAVLMHAGGGSMKSQFKRADASGARHALIFGADELQQGLVAVKSLRDPAATQTNQSINQVPAWAAQLRHP